jgi:hypothetical protein
LSAWKLEAWNFLEVLVERVIGTTRFFGFPGFGAELGFAGFERSSKDGKSSLEKIELFPLVFAFFLLLLREVLMKSLRQRGEFVLRRLVFWTDSEGELKVRSRLFFDVR